MSKIQDLLRKLPASSGVYQFLDKEGKVIYIGKAKNLKNRVKSYFQKSGDKTPKIERLVEVTQDLKWVETNSEIEALTLEANLVKEFQPKFNALLRDDKHFLYFKLTKEDFPQITSSRKVEKDGGKYFGPKTDSKSVRKGIQLIQKLFKLRVCNLGIEAKGDEVSITKKTIKYPCIYHHINLCASPCIAKISKEDYAKRVEEVEAFLEGNTSKITQRIREEMEKVAKERNFELATQLRDKLFAVEGVKEKQLASTPDLVSRDVVGVKVDFSKAYFALLLVRNGKLIDAKNFVVKVGESEIEEILESFLTQYFSISTDFPNEILLPNKIENLVVLEEWLAKQTSKKVKILFPQKGDKSRLLDLAQKNANAFAIQNKAKFENASEKTIGACNELARSLGIVSELKRIEAYDISHFAGDATSGSMVVFERGEPKSSDYRYFKIKSLAKGEVDDYASLVEVLSRRMEYLTPQSSEVKIRKATKKQIEAMQKIIEKDFPKLDRNAYKDEEWFVALKQKEIMGGFRLILRDKNHCELSTLFVMEVLQGEGIGKALVKQAIAKSPSKKLYALTALKVEFYTQLGFQEVKNIPPIFEEKIAKIFKNVGEDCEAKVLVIERKKNEDASFSTKPNLVILDGGKGQLSSVLKNVKFPKGVEVIGLAKREEEIFKMDTKGKFERVLLPRDSQALYLIQRIRDEAHRFANSLREKNQNPIKK